MKSYTPNHSFRFNAVLKFLGEAFKNMFQSSHNREFRRLKDFIAS